jgi:hypothetical protein
LSSPSMHHAWLAVVKFAAHLPCAVRTAMWLTARRLISPRKANYFNARRVSDAIFLSHPDGACGENAEPYRPCSMSMSSEEGSLLVYFRVCTQRNFQFDYHPIVTRSVTVPRGFLLAACYIHSFSQATASGWRRTKPPPRSMQRQIFRDVPWNIINVRPP